MLQKKTLVPQNIEELKAYVPGKTIAEVEEQYQPERISKLASNENRLGRSPEVDAAVVEALKTVHDYPDPDARKLKQAVADYYKISEEMLVFGAGSESLLAGLCRSFFLNKENVITSDATFIGIYVQSKIRGVKVKKIPLTTDFRFDVKAMVNAMDERTKMLYIANPNNPTGTYITREEFEWLLEKVPSEVLIVMDEAYFEYANHIEDYPDVLSYERENVIVLRTFSKGYGLAGFRVGYAIAHPTIIRYLKKTRLAFEPGTPGQAAAIAALNDQHFLSESVAMVKKGKKDLCDFFDQNGIRYANSAANFVMMILPDEETAAFINQKMLEKGVILRHIKGFGLPRCIRVTIGRPEEMMHFKKSLLPLMNR